MKRVATTKERKKERERERGRARRPATSETAGEGGVHGGDLEQPKCLVDMALQSKWQERHLRQ